MVAYLAPVVALMWGIFDGELITILHVGGLLLILVGVFLSRRSG
jgi:drug/metabolite transporter (DMT)-like permease